MLPSISDYKIKNIRRIVAMQDSTKHLQFVTAVLFSSLKSPASWLTLSAIFTACSRRRSSTTPSPTSSTPCPSSNGPTNLGRSRFPFPKIMAISSMMRMRIPRTAHCLSNHASRCIKIRPTNKRKSRRKRKPRSGRRRGSRVLPSMPSCCS